MKQPCEDDGSEESIDVGRESLFSGIMKGSFVTCGSPTTATQATARKKRRGVIEKRRRDRINNSLSELRRLVPTAFEKQGSAKLEKAEILQMTVDHLKMLQVTGMKGYHDAQVLSLDFLSLGFRECVSEVSRYLSAVEGVDSGDPLWRRLVSHLSCCASQCDAATLMAASHPVAPHHWAAVSVLHPPPYGTGGGDGASHMLLQRGPSHSESTTSPYSYTSSLELPCTPTPISASFLSLSASFPIIFHGGVPHSPYTPSTLPPSSSRSSQTPHSSRKPYWPWRPGGLGDL